jgi:hypothetical protein
VTQHPLPAASLLAVLVLTLAGCSSDGVASLTGRIERPTVSVTRSVLAGDVTGGFDLVLELGEYAGGPTEVSLGAFALERSGAELLPSLALSGAMFPVSVAVGQSRRVALTFDATAELDEADAICLGPVVFRGSVSDTLGKNRPTTLASSEATPACTTP